MHISITVFISQQCYCLRSIRITTKVWDMATKLLREQLQDAARLKKIYELRKTEDRSLTQETLAERCGWKTQSAVTQYLNGMVPLNLDALIKFSLALDVDIAEISPALAEKIYAVRVRENEPAGLSTTGFAVAKAFDKLKTPAQRAAVLAQFEAFGIQIPHTEN